MTARRLVLVEYAADVAPVLERFRGSEVRYLALCPEVMEALEERGVPYRVPEDYYAEREAQQLGWDNLERLGILVTWLDGELQRRCPEVAASRLPLARLHSYHLKILIDALTLRCMALQRVLEKERPSEIWYPTPRVVPAQHALVALDETLYGRLLPLVADGRRTRCSGYESAVPPAGLPLTLRRRVKRLIGARMVERARHFRFDRLTWYLRAYLRPPERNVLVLQESNDLSIVFRELEREGRLRLVLWNGVDHPTTLFPLGLVDRAVHPERSSVQRARRQLAAAWAELRDAPDWAALFHFSGCDLWPVAGPRMEHFVTQTVAEMLATHERTKVVIGRYRPALLVGGSPYGPFAATAAATARQEGIPVVYWQHGGLYGYAPRPVDVYLDLATADIFLAYGPHVEHGLKRLAERVPWVEPARVISLGSASLAQITANARRKSDVARDKTCCVVYAVAQFGGNFRYLPHAWLSDVRYYRLQREIVALLAAHTSLRAIVKLGSGNLASSPLPRFVRRLGAHNVTVVDHGRFTDLLAEADLVVLDWPATTLLETLAAGKRAVVYADHDVLNLRPDAAAALARRVTLCRGVELFLAELRRELGSVHRGVPFNDEFLTRYGRCDDEVNDSAARLFTDLAHGRLNLSSLDQCIAAAACAPVEEGSLGNSG